MAPTPDEPTPAPAEPLSDERLPLTELESISTRPPSWRKRGIQLALLALALCVALVALWSAIAPGNRQAIQPTPTRTPLEALLVSNLTDASIILNGKKLAGHPPMNVSAYLETDVVTITAPGFRPYTCHFQGFKTTDDPLHCLFAVNSGYVQIGKPFIIGVFLTPDDLPPTQRDQLLAPITQQLAISRQASVQPGDYIATAFDTGTGTITSQPSTTSMQASAAFVQGVPLNYPVSSPFGPFSPACAQLLCPQGIAPANYETPPSGQVWNLWLNLALTWSFAEDNGTPVVAVTYQHSPLTGQFPVMLPIRVVYDAGGWHLAADTDLAGEMQAAICNNGSAILGQRLLPYSIYSVQLLTDRGVNGCLLSVQANGQGSSTFLWRFGVLLAADDAAHTLLPDLPLAPPAEISAVA
jgi:hypothetical protein